MGYGFNQDTAQKVFDPGGFFKNQPQQPGVGGVEQDGMALQRDPTTGLFFDPRTGTSYTDANGTVPVTDPNVAQQVATNFARSQQFLGQLSGVQQQQGALAHNLSNVISGGTPSVAGMQLQGGLDSIAAQQQSQAAGVSGGMHPLAQLLAMRNTGQAQIGLNNAAGMARVQEQAGARNQLGELLSQQAGTNATLGGGMAGLAESGQQAQQNLNTNTNTQDAQKNATLGAGLLKMFAT